MNDVTSSITDMLASAGVCRLGTGEFWVSGIDMPDNTELIGSGPETKLYLLGEDSEEGYAVRMGSRCTVSNMSILGSPSDHTANDEIYPEDAVYTDRHGILWQGDASTEATVLPKRGMITNCYIAGFSGGAITCSDTGGKVISGLEVSDCVIWHCYTGINVLFNSEYNKFSNIMANNCCVGCINNGGNNIYMNSDFSKNRIGMLIDDRYSQSLNNSHGSVSNCIFNHTRDGGYGIVICGADFGEAFIGCQLFYSGIYIENSCGINFSGLNAGAGETIRISGGGLVMFDACVFRTAPAISIIDNTATHFSDCYTYDGTEVSPYKTDQ